MSGFDGHGSKDFGFTVGTVRGYRWWKLNAPDLSRSWDDWKADLLSGAQNCAWAAGVNEASCNYHPEHQPPVEYDEVRGSQCGCVSPATRILTADLQWVPAGDLETGDRLLAFDEYPANGGYQNGSAGRKYREATVANTERGPLPCYDLQFDDGTSVRVSSDHRWLCHSAQEGARWVRTDELRAGGQRASHVVKPFDPWATDFSRDGGYLAAAFDGEGSLHQHLGRYQVRLSFCQVHNPMLAETERCLKELGFTPGYSVSQHATQLRVDGTPRFDVHRLSISNKPEVMRFLGSVRPVRLLPKFQPDVLGRLNLKRCVRVVSKAYVGEQEVVKLGTTAGTYFAEGMASHNCGYWGYWELQGHNVGAAMPVAGVIEGSGRTLVGERGFRCQKARIVALYLPWTLEPAPGFGAWSKDNGQLLGPVGNGNTGRARLTEGGRRTFEALTGFGAEPEPAFGESEMGLTASEADAARKKEEDLAKQYGLAWMGIIQDRIQLLYPDVEVFTTRKAMLAKFPPVGEPGPAERRFEIP